jgi:hypothetical protein
MAAEKPWLINFFVSLGFNFISRRQPALGKAKEIQNNKTDRKNFPCSHHNPIFKTTLLRNKVLSQI